MSSDRTRHLVLIPNGHQGNESVVSGQVGRTNGGVINRELGIVGTVKVGIVGTVKVGVVGNSGMVNVGTGTSGRPRSTGASSRSLGSFQPASI